MSILAIDIGGTNIKYALVNRDGDLNQEGRVPTPNAEWDSFLKQILEIVKKFESHELEGIALSIPAPVDPVSGTILGDGSMPFLRGRQLKTVLCQSSGLPVSCENDGNCAALAEVWKGAAEHSDHMLLMVCGTGIGGALVHQRKIISGHNLVAGEFGYGILMANSEGQLSNWSALASTRALIKSVEQGLGEEIPVPQSGEAVFELEAQGNPVAVKAVDNFYRYNAIGLLNLQYIYDPELILLGGAISERPDFIQRIEQKLDEIFGEVEHGPIRPNLKRCQFLNKANLVGAAYHFISSRDKEA